MRLSTKGRYGLRAMVDLAVHYSEGLITLSSIAGRQGISESYLEQLLYTLKKGGLVNSTRGHQGGYTLAKSPDEITVSMVLDMLEGAIAPIHCVEGNTPFNCPRAEVCATKNIWEKIRSSIYGVIDSTTLKELAEEQLALDQKQAVREDLERCPSGEFSLVVLKSSNKAVNNLAFRGKWLVFKDNGYLEETNRTYSVALTEKGQLFVLTEDEHQPEKDGYSVYPSLNDLKSSRVLPDNLVSLVAAALDREEDLVFLDI